MLTIPSANQPTSLIEQTRKAAVEAVECLGFDSTRLPHTRPETDRIADENLALEGYLPQSPACASNSVAESSESLKTIQGPSGFHKKAV